DGCLPYANAKPATAQIGTHDIKAEKGEARVVVDTGDGRRRLTIELANEEAFRIDGSEAGAIGEPGIPALCRRPVDGERDFVRPHGADVQVLPTHHRTLHK